jgi:[ribosomal protein S5]-alanine N-acetyltransferase
MRFPEEVPVLTDGVVTVRAHVPEDVPRIVEQCNDPVSITSTTVPVPYGHGDAVEWISTMVPKAWADESDLCFAIEYEGRFAGSQSLRERGGGEAEVGFGLHPDARGKGVMRRALHLLLDWGFTHRGYAVVHWRANAGNWTSRRTVWALGFSFGPTIPDLLVQRGERHDGWTGWLGADDPREPTTRWLAPPLLETDRLRLRPWRAGDGPCLVEASHDAHLRHFIPSSPLPRDPADVPAYLTRIELAAADGDRVAWCVADRRTDQALGNVAIFDFEGPDDGASAQVGYWLHPDGRGRGVMTEALRRAADWAYARAPDGLGLRRLFLLTAVSNSGSRRVAEDAGFVHVGTERSAAQVGDGFEDNAIFDQLRTDERTGALRRGDDGSPR